MTYLTWDGFEKWLEAYGRASQENDPKTSADLFAPDARYYETPFDEPLVGREAIYRYWSKGAQTLRDKESSYEVLAIRGNLGIARWRAKFTNIRTGKRSELDCLFLVEFCDQAMCSVFREWWHLRALGAAANGEAI